MNSNLFGNIGPVVCIKFSILYCNFGVLEMQIWKILFVFTILSSALISCNHYHGRGHHERDRDGYRTIHYWDDHHHYGFYHGYRVRPPRNNIIEPAVLKKFADDAGVAHFSERVDNVSTSSHIITGDIDNFQVVQTNPLILSNLNMQSETTKIETLTGNLNVYGNDQAVTIYKDKASGAITLFGLEQNNVATVVARGTTISSIPRGIYTFDGASAVIKRGAGNTLNVGDFDMTVNFEVGTGQIRAQNPISLLTGNFAVNTARGTYSGRELDLTAEGSEVKASIYGNFHGVSATGVSGVYHDNTETPIYYGGIAGARTTSRE